MVLGFYEMRAEDQPPEHLWLDDDALAEHLERISDRHRSGAEWSEVPDAPLEQNELTRGLR